MNWKTLAVIACVAGMAAAPAQAQTLSQAEKRALVEKAGTLLSANYVFPDRAAAAKARLDAALAAGAYDAITTPEAFAEKLTGDLQAVTRDGHLALYVLAPSRPGGGAPAAAAERVYAGFARIDRLKGNIGYIKMRLFPDPAGPFAQTAIQAFTDLAGTDALIIDLRDNGGGNFDSVFQLASFLFDPGRKVHLDSHISRKPGTAEFSTREFFTAPVPVSYADKPVYLLMSKRTVSAGETFLYALQTQKRARLVGEATRGAANGSRNLPLSSGIRMIIPFQRAVNPITGTNFEGTGVKPDLAVEESLAFQAAMREIVASNPARYAALKALVESRSAEDGFVEASLLKFRDQPQPGGEAAVRSLLSGIAAGKPDYARMSDTLAQAVRDDFDFFHTDMREFGEARSVTFTGVASTGLDNYEVRSAAGTKRFTVYLNPDGKIAAAGFYPTIPLRPQPQRPRAPV
jgi:hypothetical protein